MPDNTRPPLRWLFGKREQRREALRYWIVHSLVGPLNMSIHYSLRLLPIDACSAVGAILGAFAQFRLPAKDARARAVWMRVRPQDADKATTDAAMKRLWRNVGRSMAEFSVLDRLWDAGRIEVVGMKNLEAARDSARPLIGLGLHLGNWETIGIALLKNGLMGGSIYVPPDNRFDQVIAARARERIAPGGAILARQNAAAEAFIMLTKKKQHIVLYADELNRGRVWGPAFGRDLRINGNIGNAVRLARLSHALILPVYSERLDDRARFRVTVLPTIELPVTDNRDEDLLRNIAAIDALIDPIVRAHLDQWFFALDFEFD
jgi:KDO2-lipid IV(A) lauroyltransferase